MSTVIRAQLSKKNQYHLPKHRYYELVHFCLQYPDFVKEYNEMNLEIRSPKNSRVGNSQKQFKPTEEIATKRAILKENIELIEESAKEAGRDLYRYLLLGVTKGYAYPYLSTKLDMPCCRASYYEMYRKFFYVLNARK